MEPFPTAWRAEPRRVAQAISTTTSSCRPNSETVRTARDRARGCSSPLRYDRDGRNFRSRPEPADL